jgi:hypothetical protein
MLYIANIIFDFLHSTLTPYVFSSQHPDCHACKQIWPVNSLVINPPNFFLGGLIKEKQSPKKCSLILWS